QNRSRFDDVAFFGVEFGETAADAETERDLADIDIAVKDELVAGTISEASLDQATAARAMAAARADSANEAMKLLQEGSRVEDIAA
ncbi:hypothetical protein ACC738_38140, partial [Rhizobium ruizarguesonis]